MATVLAELEKENRGLKEKIGKLEGELAIEKEKVASRDSRTCKTCGHPLTFSVPGDVTCKFCDMKAELDCMKGSTKSIDASGTEIKEEKENE